MKGIAYPILRRLPYEGTLTSSCARITLNGVSPRPDEIIQLGQFDYEGIPVVFVERPLLEVVLNKGGLEGEIRLFLRWEW